MPARISTRSALDRPVDLACLYAKFLVVTPQKTLPAVILIRDQIDTLFVRFVGPVGVTIAQEEFAEWLKIAPNGPSALSRYIQALSVNIFDKDQRSAFIRSALSKIEIV